MLDSFYFFLVIFALFCLFMIFLGPLFSFLWWWLCVDCFLSRDSHTQFELIFWRTFWKRLDIDWLNITKLMIMVKKKCGRCRNKPSESGKPKLHLLLRYMISRSLMFLFLCFTFCLFVLYWFITKIHIFTRMPLKKPISRITVFVLGSLYHVGIPIQLDSMSLSMCYAI